MPDFPTIPQAVTNYVKLIARNGRYRRRGRRTVHVFKAAVVSLGLLTILLFLYGAWFWYAEPTVPEDYFALRQALLRPTAEDVPNGWDHYVAAIEAYVETPNDSIGYPMEFHLNDANWRELEPDIAQWVQANETCWHEFLAGSQAEYAWFECDPCNFQAIHEHPWQEGRIPNLGVVGLWRGRLQAEAGDLAGAMDNCLAMARMGRQRLRNDVSLEHHIGLRTLSIMWSEMKRLLDAYDFDATTLKTTQDALEQLLGEGLPVLSTRSMKFDHDGMIQANFSTGGIGGGHLLPKVFMNYLSIWDVGYMKIKRNFWEDVGFNAFLYVGAAMFHVRRSEVEQKAAEYWRIYEQQAALTPYERHVRGIATMDEWRRDLSRARYFFLPMTLPPLERTLDHRYRCQAGLEGTIAVLALKRWFTNHGAYPEDLATLVENAYLKRVPRDPYSADGLRYKLRGDGFALYCVGADFDDDGGVPGDVSWGLHEEGGDAVLWPVSWYREPRETPSEEDRKLAEALKTLVNLSLGRDDGSLEKLLSEDEGQ